MEKKCSFRFYKIELKDDISKKYLNVSAKKLKNKRKLNFSKNILKVVQILIPWMER